MPVIAKATEATPSTLREIASARKLPRNDNAITSFAPPPKILISCSKEKTVSLETVF
jgi:hypothetical protein